MLTADKI